MRPDLEIWLDNHISPIIAKWITDEFGIAAKSSFVLQLSLLDDIDIFNKARAAGNIVLLTKDADFEPLVNKFGSPPKIINLIFGNSDNRVVWQKLKSKLMFSLDALF